MVLLLLGVMTVFMVLGFPMLMSMIVAPILTLLVFFPNVDPLLMIQQLVNGVSVFVLIAVPMFIFAADIMTAGHTANRLIDLVRAFFGHIHGGLAITVAGACTLFGAMSGSTQATVVAIGKPTRNNMLKLGYKEEDVTGLIISSANIALLIPPSVVMIMYCVVTGVSVGEMFIAGVGPGLLIFASFALWSYFSAKKKNIPRSEKTTWAEKAQAIKKGILPMGFPALIVGGIYSGLFSPTEAAAASVLYAIILEMIIYRTVSLKDLGQIALSTGAVTATVFILVAGGQALSWVITFAKVPQMLTSALLGPNPSATMILGLVTLFFFIGCMFVDQLVVIVVLAPIFYPVAVKAGIDPIHLGIIVSLQAAIGSITPPFGCNIFTASAIFDQSFTKVIKGLPPYLVILGVISIIMIFVPEVALFFRDLAY